MTSVSLISKGVVQCQWKINMHCSNAQTVETSGKVVLVEDSKSARESREESQCVRQTTAHSTRTWLSSCRNGDLPFFPDSEGLSYEKASRRKAKVEVFFLFVLRIRKRCHHTIRLHKSTITQYKVALPQHTGWI